MSIWIKRSASRAAWVVPSAVLAAAMVSGGAVPTLVAQAPQAAAPAAGNRALGTVRSVSGTALVVGTDAGATVNVTLSDAVRVQQLAPGSTDLKTAEASTADQISVGDRVLVSGTAGTPGTLTASRVILMKSSAIAQRNQSSQADWTRRGSGGIVTAVDPAAKTISISSGTRKVAIDTSASTVFRRYAPGSVSFEDATPGTLADLHPGDQLRVRGDKSADGLTMTADEVVSGSFKNLSGTIVSVNPTANSLIIRDLATKKNETVAIGAESDLRNLPPEMAARFAPRPRAAAAGGSAAAAGAAGAGARPGAPASPSSGAAAPGTSAGAPQSGAEAAGAPRRPGGYGGAGNSAAGEASGGSAAGAGAGGYGAGRAAGAAGGRAGDLSQVIPRLPKTTVADLKPGAALMIVASGNSGGGPYTAITVLSGVEPLLTGPAGSEMSISPWSLGSGGGGGEGGGPE